MKAFVLSLVAFAALAVLASTSYGQARAGDVKIEKISPAVVKTPQFQLQSGPIKRSKDLDWLEVEVEFSTAPEMTDELSFVYKILVNGKLLVGTVDHVDIPKGRDHYSVAYVSPRTLDKIMNGKTLTSAAIQGVWVEVTKQGQVIASHPLTPKVPNLQQETGKVLNKSQTPFAPLYYDRYEALKATPR